MNARCWMLAVLIAGWTAAAHAQNTDRDGKLWTIRYVSVVDLFNDFNGQGFVDYLDEEGFGETQQGFLGPISNPRASAEGGTGWTLLATYAYRSWLRIGASIHRAPNMSTRGYRSSSGRIRLSHEMWAVAPVAVWTPASNLAVGVGPALIRGTATFFDARILFNEEPGPSREDTFLRLGAVALASLGFTLFRTVYLGVQGQYLWGGEAEVGPYEFGERTLEAGAARLDQFTVGPVVEVRF